MNAWKVTPEKTCDAPLCGRCAVRVGPDRDQCPSHRSATFAAARVKLYTATYNYRGDDRVDTTRVHKGTTDTWGLAFAPPYWLLGTAKGWDVQLPRGIEAPPDDEAGAWGWYATHYTEAMRASYRTKREAWEFLLGMETATVVCFCASPEQCHRGLLAGILTKLGATYEGER